MQKECTSAHDAEKWNLTYIENKKADILVQWVFSVGGAMLYDSAEKETNVV